MTIHRITIEIGLDLPAYYLASDAVAYCFALELQEIMEYLEHKETVMGKQVLSIEGTIDHQTGAAWITMLTLEKAISRSRCTQYPMP